jgi:hypothetical protein
MRFPRFRFALRLTIGAALALYASAVVLVGASAVFAIKHLGAAVLTELPSADAERQGHVTPPSAPAGFSVAVATPAQIVQRDGAMTPLYDRWDERWSGRGASIRVNFGSSSRGMRSFYRDEDDEDEDRRERWGGTYRTLCVRLCDGFYFPISFATPRERLAHDARVCESRCGGQGRLFVHRSPAGAIEDAEDLSGRPYRKLPTAFLYRTQYVASCTCQPHPWEAASLARHQGYAIAAAARTGNKDALRELQASKAAGRQTVDVASDALAPVSASEKDGIVPGVAGGIDASPIVRPGMARSSRPPQTEKARMSRISDWRRRSFAPFN